MAISRVDREAPKQFPKPHLHQKKVRVTVWWSAASLIHYSFLNPGKTITCEKYTEKIDEMDQKPQSLQPTLVNRMSPIFHDNAGPHIIQPMLQKLNKWDYEALPHESYSPDISPNNYHFFKHLDNFLQGKHFHNCWRQNMPSKSSLKSEGWIFMLQE